MLNHSSGRRCVKLIYRDRPGCKVCVAGDFSDWKPSKELIDKDNNGTYCCQLRLPPGEYQYKFVVDDQWCIDPENPNFSPNGVGSLNSVIIISEK